MRAVVCFATLMLTLVVPAFAQADRVVCPGPRALQGVDVSGERWDWTQASRSGYRFAFIKATEGASYVNPDLVKTWDQAGEAGVARSAYHYFIPWDEPVAQARFFLSTLWRYELGGELPPMVDLEARGRASAQVYVERLRSFLDRVKGATGKSPILYVSPAFWKELGEPEGFEKYPLYIADWSAPCPVVPAPWSTWAFWQMGYGIQVRTGIVDIDLFNGSQLD